MADQEETSAHCEHLSITDQWGTFINQTQICLGPAAQVSANHWLRSTEAYAFL